MTWWVFRWVYGWELHSATSSWWCCPYPGSLLTSWCSVESSQRDAISVTSPESTEHLRLCGESQLGASRSRTIWFTLTALFWPQWAAVFRKFLKLTMQDMREACLRCSFTPVPSADTGALWQYRQKINTSFEKLHFPVEGVSPQSSTFHGGEKVSRFVSWCPCAFVCARDKDSVCDVWRVSNTACVIPSPQSFLLLFFLSPSLSLFLHLSFFSVTFLSDAEGVILVFCWLGASRIYTHTHSPAVESRGVYWIVCVLYLDKEKGKRARKGKKEGKRQQRRTEWWETERDKQDREEESADTK